jgi:Family of unknown function (DUF6111)
MLRLVEVALFIAPFVAFAVWRFMAIEGGPPVSLVVGAACVLAVLASALIWLSQENTLPPGDSYEPPRLENGKIVSGHAAPR